MPNFDNLPRIISNVKQAGRRTITNWTVGHRVMTEKKHEIFSPVIVSEFLRYLERCYRKVTNTQSLQSPFLRLVVEMRAESGVYFCVILFFLTKILNLSKDFGKILPKINFMKTSQVFLEFQMLRDEPTDMVKLSRVEHSRTVCYHSSCDSHLFVFVTKRPLVTKCQVILRGRV